MQGVGFNLLIVGTLMSTEMTIVGPGRYRPLFRGGEKAETVDIKPFWLDRLPVTQGQFLDFVRMNPEWQKGHVPSLFADERYLSDWRTETDLGNPDKQHQPVVWVSWFAARAYCQNRKARLATEQEWEFAAAASDKAVDGRNDPLWLQTILSWYSKPADDEPIEVGESRSNVWGIYDLHGLIWEWIDDLPSIMVGGDSRENGGGDKQQFCGAGAANAQDKSDYANFMRAAFRASLTARSTAKRLGFRCARNFDRKGF